MVKTGVIKEAKAVMEARVVKGQRAIKEVGGGKKGKRW